MSRFDRAADGYISYDSFCESVIVKDFTFPPSAPAAAASARPSTAPARRELQGDSSLLVAYARAEATTADAIMVNGVLTKLRSVFADRGSKLATIFREIDTTRSGARARAVVIARAAALRRHPFSRMPPPSASHAAQARLGAMSSARRSAVTTSA